LIIRELELDVFSKELAIEPKVPQGTWIDVLPSFLVDSNVKTSEE
jgi:hypothetical protein